MSGFSLLQRIIILSLFTGQALCLTATIPVAAPSAAKTISPSLISFSIEQDRWTDWSGTTSRNQFFFNTLNNLAQITGEPPRLRIGANSEDRTDFDSGVQFSEATFGKASSKTPYPEASHIIVGDGYYEAAQWLPPNTHVTWGVNLKTDNITMAYLQAKSMIKAFASKAVKNAGIKLDYIEIGNESDHYATSLTELVELWTTFANNLTTSCGLTTAAGTTKFWGASFAADYHETTWYAPQGLIAAGILDSKGGALLTAMSVHNYAGSFCGGHLGSGISGCPADWRIPAGLVSHIMPSA